MDDQERLNSFLDDFRDLESTLAKLAGVKSGYSSYSRSLQDVFKSKKSPLIRSGDNFNFLKSAGELRNLVTHNNDIAYPTQEFYDRFHRLSWAIRFPAKAEDIMTKGKNLVTASLDTKILSLVRRMNSKGLSHVPVIDDGKVLGIFSSSTFFDALSENGNLAIDGDTPLESIKEIIAPESHSSEDFLFCAKDSYVYEFSKRIQTKNKGQKKRIVAVLVTENGFSSGRLVGIITPTDLLKL